MNSLSFSLLFAAFLLCSTMLRLWLSLRHIRHVQRHRHAVPAQFAEKIPLAAHQKAADYTLAKARFDMFALLYQAVVLTGFTLLGGLDLLAHILSDLLGQGMLFQLSLLAAFMLISTTLDLPLSYYAQFRLEHAFGFNRMTPRLFWLDTMKSMLLFAALGLPLAWLVLFLMERSAHTWWWLAWIVWVVFQLVMMLVYPTWIAPLFNRFTPLEDAPLKARIEALLQRVGFAAGGLFVMDGSRRSAHGNAYFSGFGQARRIVFFDTLIDTLTPAEIEAVLAHELGHFKLRHIQKRLLLSFAASLALLAVLGYLKNQTWFYLGLGVTPVLLAHNDALALLLFSLALPVFTFFLSPLLACWSRRHEFEADDFAATHTRAGDLISALVKMYEDNAATLTPDPLFSAFHDSHPAAPQRVAHLHSRVPVGLS